MSHRVSLTENVEGGESGKGEGFGKIGSIVDYRGEVYLTFFPSLKVPVYRSFLFTVPSVL